MIVVVVAGVCKYSHPASAVDQLDSARWLQAVMRDVSRAVVAQVPAEGFWEGADVAFFDQLPRDMRAATRPFIRERIDPLDGDVDANRRQLLHHAFGSAGSGVTKLG